VPLLCGGSLGQLSLFPALLPCQVLFLLCEGCGPGLLNQKPPTLQAPTWSWASQGVHVNLNLELGQPRCTCQAQPGTTAEQQGGFRHALEGDPGQSLADMISSYSYTCSMDCWGTRRAAHEPPRPGAQVGHPKALPLQGTNLPALNATDARPPAVQ